MLVKDIMTTCVSCLKPEASISQAAKQMKQDNIGSLPVCTDSGQVMGILTDRDITIRAVANSAYPRQGAQSSEFTEQKAQDIMSTAMIYATPNMNLHDAANLMSKHQIRRLPVISNKRLVGIISLADIARKNICIDEAGDVLSAVSKPNGLS